jgi:hypothetical protein
MAKAIINSINAPFLNITIKVEGKPDYTANIDSRNVINLADEKQAIIDLEKYAQAYEDGLQIQYPVDAKLTAKVGKEISFN